MKIPPKGSFYLVKENRFWEILFQEKNEKISVKTKYGLINGKITETLEQEFDKSKGHTFIKKKITDKTRNGYKNLKSNVKIDNKQVLNFVKPMGASLIEKHKGNIVFPADAQPKLDGFRGIAFVKNGKVSIVSKNGLPYPHLSQIKEEIKILKNLKLGNLKFDGELYLHGQPLGNLKSILSRKTLNNEKLSEVKNIKYCIFDIIDENLKSEKRLEILEKAFSGKKFNFIGFVGRTKVNSLKEIQDLKEKYLKEGYEGIIIRNRNGLYRPGKISKDVFRSKDFYVKKFKIVGAVEGKGNDKGTVIWELQCLKDVGKTFMAKPIGSKSKRSELFKNREKYIGSYIPVKYFEIDNITGCVTRHPVAIS